MTVSTSIHACIQIVFAKERLPLFAGEPASLDGVDHNLGLWFASPNRAQQRLQGDVGCHARLHRPSDNTPGVQVDYDSQI